MANNLNGRMVKLEEAVSQRYGAWLRTATDEEIRAAAAGVGPEIAAALSQMTDLELEAIVDGDMSPLRRMGVEP